MDAEHMDVQQEYAPWTKSLRDALFQWSCLEQVMHCMACAGTEQAQHKQLYSHTKKWCWSRLAYTQHTHILEIYLVSLLCNEFPGCTCVKKTNPVRLELM